MEYKIEDFPRLGKVLFDFEKLQLTGAFGDSRSGCARTCLTMNDFTEKVNQPYPYFLYSKDKMIIEKDGDIYNRRKINYDGLDCIINHFINRRIYTVCVDDFISRFASKFDQIKEVYCVQFNSWSQFYEMGINPLKLGGTFEGDLPFLSDGVTVSISTAESTSNTSDINKNTGVNINITDSEDSTISKVVGSGSSTSNGVGNSKSTSDTKSETEGKSTDSAIGSTTSKVRNKNLFSDMPHSNVGGQINTPDIGDVNWDYATSMNEDSNKSEGTTTNTNKNENSSETKGYTTSETDTTDRTTSTNDNETNSNVVGVGKSKGTSNNDSTSLNVGSTSNKNNSDNMVVAYKGTQATIEAFLSSHHATAFWSRLFAEFEEYFLNIHDSEHGDLFTWKVRADGVGIIKRGV